ncbi:hypothetical protein C0Q70_06048 [Pomacea canaliculata]|uniref:Uncharacterized protein n=1 Tax=Pomacea canaliculata TaxID=400727 RepID=A0A2T7PMX5_POMCA|nr:hypothetical protein C0Q70_06048 [Pomacea canaliculata]
MRRGITVDADPPQERCGCILMLAGGSYQSSLKPCLSDGDRISDVEELGFNDLNPPDLQYYMLLVGDTNDMESHPGGWDVLNFRMLDVTWDHISLSEGVRYYTTVRACNVIDWCTEMASDGILIDTTPPVAGDVWDGAGDADIWKLLMHHAFYSARDFLAANGQDCRCELRPGCFTWRSGTSPGATDIMHHAVLVWRLKPSHQTSQLHFQKQDIYITITAKDRAGNWIEVTSNGFKVDTTAPTVKQVPQLNGGLGTLGGPRLVSRDTLSARWSLEDAGSPVAAHFPVRVKVTTCNVARLCTTSVSEEILHDSTPPVTGMFAVKTDHAANLRRHLDGWMVWSSQQLRLAWLGFLDVHSGLDHYIISVGSTPFANDLNLENTVIKVFHNGSGTQYENEGFVQVYEVSTKPLTAALKIFIAIWAVNKVGLQSHPALSEFELEEGGGMSLVRRCTPFNCLAQCFCAVQGATCNASSCAPLPEESNPNSLLTVYDHADLTTLISPRTSSSSSSSEDYTPSSSYLAASWNVKEHAQAGQDKDVDYVTRSDSLHTSWRGTFLNTTAPLQSFQVYVGTSVEGNDVHSSGPLSGNTESYYATGLSLREDTLYYTTVVAVGSSGLMSWDVSDGFMLDLQPPVAGLVLDGDGLHDADYQLYDQLISAKWFGFTDSGSGIRRFYWCVGTTNDSDTCNVMQWTDVGLKTKGSFTPSSPLNQGTIFYSKVYAVDAVGHRSSVSVSDGVKVDITPPRALDIIYTDNINHVNNPSFEDDVTSNTGQIVCDSKPPSSWKIGPGSCIILQHPRHAISADGTQHVLLSGAVMQSVSGLTSGLVYRLTVRLAHPETLRDHHKPVQGYVQIGTQQHTFTLDPAMCRGVCDTEKEPVIMWHSFTYVVTAHNSTLTLVISTTSSSTDQQLALDYVVLETIHYVQQTETSRNVTSESHLSASAVFLPHWSMVQSSWHFLDNDSPITDYKWALGTVAGGVQIQGFKGVGQRQHGSALGLTLHHGTPLYVTVVASNAAGLTTVAYSSPLLCDTNQPTILFFTEEDVDFQTGFFIGASWRATDYESSVAYCQWAIGFEAGSGEISPFQRAPQPTSNTYTITADVGFSLKDLKLPQTLYVSVRCYNKAGLPGFGHTDGLTITPDNEEAKLGGLRFLGDSITVYPVREACQVMQNRLRMSWQNFASLNPLAGFQIDHYSNIDQDSYQTKNLPYLLEATRISGLALTNNTMHTWSVSPVDAFGSVGKAVNKSVHVSMNAPTVKASGQAEFNRNGTHLTLSWRNLFTSDWPDHDLTFEVSVGSVKGGTDILHWHKTTDSSVIVSFVSKVTSFSLYYIVTAIDPCGYHLASTGSVKIN